MKEYGRYVIGILLLIGAIILIVVGFNIVRNLFSSGPDEEKATPSKSINLRDAPTKNQAVRFTQFGRVVGQEKHYDVRITVNNSERLVEIIEGYNGQVIKSARHTNTKEAYDAFVAALNGAGYTSQRSPEERGTEQESCSQGFRYVYEVAPGSNDSFRSWSTSCTSKQGTFGGEAGEVRQLFQRQIPDYDRFINDARITL